MAKDFEIGIEEKWDRIIESKSSWVFSLKDLREYKDLIYLFVRRDLKSFYKQTVLGPFWIIAQPVITAITFSVIFGRLAGLSTDGVPHLPFYFSGFFFWSFFSEGLVKTSETFHFNADLFSKVFFPRMVVPLAGMGTLSVKFALNFLLLLILLIFFSGKSDFQINWVYFPILLPLFLILSVLSLSCGMLISAMTTKYRDIRFLVQFGVQLLMYLSPVVFPLSMAEGKLKFLIQLNPVTSLIEAERFVFFGKGEFSLLWIGYSAFLAILLFVFGTVVFRRVERNFIDTV